MSGAAIGNPSTLQPVVQRLMDCGDSAVAVRLLLRGLVQGVGARPQLARLAIERGLCGFVRNCPAGVELHLEGQAAAVGACLHQLSKALVDSLQAEVADCQCVERIGAARFQIREASTDGVLSTPVPRDVAVCPQCLAEMYDVSNRRHGFAFISCTACGPRYSAVRTLPFERAATALQPFVLCAACRREYADPHDRRFHAQTTGCPECGPRLWLDGVSQPQGAATTLHDQQAVCRAAELLRAGGILALKGLGGAQLLCDATQPAAVQVLRQRKQRPAKPFPVMLTRQMLQDVRCDALSAGRVCLTWRELQEFLAPENPIVIVPWREMLPADGAPAAEWRLAAEIHPKLMSVGLLRPTTAVHQLLLDMVGRPLVVTSGNREAEPLQYRDAEVPSVLAELADAVLWHDRSIERPIDDSVVLCLSGQRVTIRLARGLAPCPLRLQTSQVLLAVGAEQKVALAVANGQEVALGPHIGDLRTLAARQRFMEQAQALCQLYQCKPAVVVHDLHPDYFTTQWAEQQRSADSSPSPVDPARGSLVTGGQLVSDMQLGWPVQRTIAVQHHHAHLAAAMLEQGWLDRTVLGMAFDGTGYGTDGTIWGGEFLLADSRQFVRVASLLPFPLPGGDAAIREPWRVAATLLRLALPELNAAALGDLLLWSCQDPEQQRARTRRPQPDSLQADIRRQLPLLLQVIDSQLCPVTSSLGRLFDGVATWLLGPSQVGYEGEPAASLEAICDHNEPAAYNLPLRSVATPQSMAADLAVWQLDWRVLIRELAADLQQRGATRNLPQRATSLVSRPPEDGVVARLAMKFHRSVAQASVEVARRYSAYPVVLSGGCFQNRVLSEQLLTQLRGLGREVTLPQQIPPNDGGLAAGQLAIAAAMLDHEARGTMTTMGAGSAE